MGISMKYIYMDRKRNNKLIYREVDKAIIDVCVHVRAYVKISFSFHFSSYRMIQNYQNGTTREETEIFHAAARSITRE